MLDVWIFIAMLITIRAAGILREKTRALHDAGKIKDGDYKFEIGCLTMSFYSGQLSALCSIIGIAMSIYLASGMIWAMAWIVLAVLLMMVGPRAAGGTVHVFSTPRVRRPVRRRHAYGTYSPSMVRP